MARRDSGPSVKDKHLHEKLRDEGNSKKKSKRITNAAPTPPGRASAARAAAGTTETGEVPEL
jgi:hypothetical protein